MNNNDFDSIDDELDVTLETGVAESIEVGATIKAVAVDHSQGVKGITLLANSGNSQNITMTFSRSFT